MQIGGHRDGDDDGPPQPRESERTENPHQARILSSVSLKSDIFRVLSTSLGVFTVRYNHVSRALLIKFASAYATLKTCEVTVEHQGRPPLLGSIGQTSAKTVFVGKEIEKTLAEFRHRRTRDKRKSYAIQMATVSLSGITTVLLGLNLTDMWDNTLRNIALVLSAAITVVAATEAFYSHRELWIIRTDTVRRLELLDRRYRYFVAGLQGDTTAEVDVVEAFLRELEQVLVNDQRQWQEIRKSNIPNTHSDERQQIQSEKSTTSGKPTIS